MYNFVIQLCTILLCIIYIIYNNNKILKKKIIIHTLFWPYCTMYPQEML